MDDADEWVAKVRDATDIVAMVSPIVLLRRVGSRLVGRCPFHADDLPPSFSVNPYEGVYYCFGCQARGDAITFVRETQGLGLDGAVRFLAARAGIVLE